MKWLTVAASGGALIFGQGTTTGSIYQAVKYGKYEEIPNRVLPVIRKNWMVIFALPVLGALLSRVLGRFAPRAGIPGAISIKSF